MLQFFLFSCSVVSMSPQTAAYQTSLSFTVSQSLLKLVSVKSVMTSNHLILCHPLLLLPSIFPSIRVFSNEWTLHIRWLKCWSFSISPSIEYSGLISFRMDLLDLLAVQGPLFCCCCCCWTVLILLMGICVYSVTLFIVVINLCLYIGLLQLCGVFLSPLFSFFFRYFFFSLF